MKSKNARYLTLTVALLICIAVGTTAQQPAGGQSTDIGPSADSIRPYRAAGRDPFRKYVAPKVSKDAKTKDKNKVLGFPSLAVRRAEFQQKAEQARARDLPEPDPVGQYLVGELDVTGVFRDDRGFGAFVRAQPTGTTFFVRNGTHVYNGEVLRIESDESDSDGSKVLFREIARFEQNGKQSQQERVVAKLPVRAAGKTK
jgi:hypothetical protein